MNLGVPSQLWAKPGRGSSSHTRVALSGIGGGGGSAATCEIPAVVALGRPQAAGVFGSLCSRLVKAYFSCSIPEEPGEAPTKPWNWSARPGRIAAEEGGRQEG